MLVGGLKRVRAHDGPLDLVCTREQILKIFRITGLTKVFGIHQTVDQAIAAKKGAGKERIRTLIGVISPPSRPRYRQSAFTRTR